MLTIRRLKQTLDKTDVHEDPQFMPAAGGDKYHGNDGPIHVSFNDWYMPLEVDFAKAAHDVTGTEKTINDAWSGDHLGFYSSLGAVNRSDDPGNRSYAATGYLRPNLGRSNLKVLTEAHATKIILDGETAKGVEFVHKGKKYSVHAKKEVVLSAGVIQSPQLLELSGIGDPEVLQAAGVDVVVENKGVGANFQGNLFQISFKIPFEGTNSPTILRSCARWTPLRSEAWHHLYGCPPRGRVPKGPTGCLREDAERPLWISRYDDGVRLVFVGSFSRGGGRDNQRDQAEVFGEDRFRKSSRKGTLP